MSFSIRDFLMGKDSGGNMELTTVATDGAGSGDAVNETKRKEEKVVIGKIIKVSTDGWGFIIAQDIPFTRIFFHWTSLVHDTKKFPELTRGMHVEFVPVDKGDRGYHAIKVKIVNEPAKPQ